MPVELTWHADRLDLYNELVRRNDTDTHAVRNMLWFILSGRIAEGHVFVDEWPFFTQIACMHPSHLYRPNSDMDFVTVGLTGEDGAEYDQSKFRRFFRDLIEARRWRERPGAVLGYVNARVVDVACESLSPAASAQQQGHISAIGPFRQYTAAEKENLDMYDERRDAAVAKLKHIGLILDRLKPHETPLVAKESAYVVPYQADMLRWLSKVLPSACIRRQAADDHQQRPVSWIASYSCGAFGASYVEPEFRGRRLAEVMTLEMVCSMARIISSSRFFWISDSNKASINQVQRMYVDLKPSGTLAKCVVFTPAVSSMRKVEQPARPHAFVPGSGWMKGNQHQHRPQHHHAIKKPGVLVQQVGVLAVAAAKGLRYLR